MSSDIYARPDLSKKARYTRKVEEDGGEWEEKEVDIYQSVDDIRYDPTGFQAQEGGTQSEKHPPVQKGAFRGATLVLSVLCLLLFAGIIALIIYLTLEKDPLKTKVLEANNSQLRDEVKRLNAETHELKANNSHQERRYETLRQNHTQLLDEVKRLNTKTHELKVNNSQLQDEVKKLKDVIEGKWCPEGWTGSGYSWYFKSTQKKTWFESRRDCQSKGADLVIINSNEEQEFVRRLSYNEASWIGLENKWTSQGREWKWVDGSPLTVKFWADREPHYSDNYRVCYNYLGRWTSTNYNSYTLKWICEKQISCFH